MIVAIVGAESTGKTALARALAERTGGAWVPEFLREWCDRAQRMPRPDEQPLIAAEQQRRIEDAARTHRLVFADTVPLQTAVYSDFIFGDGALYAPALAWHASRVGLTLLTGLDLPWQPDVQRDGAQVRPPVDELLRAALEDAGLPYAVVYGFGEARLAAALAALPSSAPNPEDMGPRWRPRCMECLDPDCERALHPRPSH